MLTEVAWLFPPAIRCQTTVPVARKKSDKKQPFGCQPNPAGKCRRLLLALPNCQAQPLELFKSVLDGRSGLGSYGLAGGEQRPRLHYPPAEKAKKGRERIGETLFEVTRAHTQHEF